MRSSVNFLYYIISHNFAGHVNIVLLAEFNCMHVYCQNMF